MKIAVIHPGASWSTADVYTGLISGLRSIPNLDIHGMEINSILNWFETMIDLGVNAGMLSDAAYRNDVLNRQRMASAHITQAILDLWPDVVISVSGHNYHLRDVDILRRVGIKTAVILTESPYFGELEGMMAQHYDIAFTNERCSAKRLNATYLPHAYNPAVHTVDGPLGFATDAVFVGSMFDERRERFNGVDWTGINFLWRGHDMTETPSDVTPNAEAAAYYRATNVAINHHRTTTSHGSGQHIRPEEAASLGPRAYEIAACGAFQLMDDSRAEAKEIFGESLVTYRAGDSADLERQLRKWLRASEREEWAMAQHEAVLPHSWDVRAKQVLERLV
jgi:spore maturation protein CgeB